MLLTDEIKEVLSTRTDPIGTVHRFKDHNRNSGALCTGDSNALAVYKIIDGWLYKCFRCGDRGKIKNEGASPKEVLAYVRQVDNTAYDVYHRENQADQSIESLPIDCVPMNSDSVPQEAKAWLYRYKINESLMDRYKIYWSECYKRIIFPVRNTHLLNKEKPLGSLLGWIGRVPSIKDVAPNNPKWLKKSYGHDDNFVFHLMGEGDICVIVEDVVSAIRVHQATGLSVVALMGTTMPNKLLFNFKEFRLKIWLDGDALHKAIKHFFKCKVLGISAQYSYTPLDPKSYGDEGIKIHTKFVAGG